MKRLVQPELLDALAADDPRAVRSRRDLRRLNTCMGNATIAARALRNIFPASPPRQIVEIGAGDGVFLLNVARALSRSSHREQSAHESTEPATAWLVDQQNLLGVETQKRLATFNWSARAWQADVFEFFENGAPVADVVIANLFLHHFSTKQLSRLFQSLRQKTKVLIAIEPRRSRPTLLFSRMLWMIGCNSVTRHDAVASVRAGFTGSELSALWPDQNRWQLKEQPAGTFSHLFVACLKN
jgi:hypothetical protein